jgi:hypothetical protein
VGRRSGRTGTGLRNCSVWRTKSWGLARIVILGVWRIIIMAEGRMAMARVALNMAAVEWRVESRGVAGLRAVPSQELHAGARSSRSEVASPAIAESLIGCVESKRSQPIANFTDDKTSTTSNCRHTTPLHSSKTTAIMSDNENGDEMVTKPFKFVTGTPPRARAQLQ